MKWTTRALKNEKCTETIILHPQEQKTKERMNLKLQYYKGKLATQL